MCGLGYLGCRPLSSLLASIVCPTINLVYSRYMTERIDQLGKERIQRGQLYFLSHPGSDIFSGYGLTTQEGRNDHLAGVLIIDRPRPLDPDWLNRIDGRHFNQATRPSLRTRGYYR